MLDAAADFLRQTELEWASFHSFRRDVGAVWLLKQENDWENTEVQIDPETGSLLSLKDIETLESFVEESQGYFYKMFSYINDFINSGTDAGRFSYVQAQEDLQLALWYAYACNNMDEYEYYHRVCQWMPFSEKARPAAAHGITDIRWP